MAGNTHKNAEKFGFSEEELERYARHLVIPEVGVEGQKKLKSSSVLVVGAGGLGSPAAIYLAAAGVGKIGLIDFDSVSFSNLQRQVLFSTDDVGKPKAETAKLKLQALNPEIGVSVHAVKLDADNALDIISGYDVIIDGSDNFTAKYIINDACVLLDKPDVFGTILRFEGQVSVFYSKEGPCYRCLFPSAPASVPTCAEAGVLGVLPGIVGSIQANEAIKFILGKGELLTGRLLMIDALAMKFKEVKLKKDPKCQVCGKKPGIRKLIKEQIENISDSIPETGKNFMTVEELKKKIDNCEKFILLDVREPFEKLVADIGGMHIPVKQIPERVDELNKQDEIIIYCRTDNRSTTVMEYLRDRHGFKNVKVLVGGIYAWSDRIDPAVKKY